MCIVVLGMSVVVPGSLEHCLGVLYIELLRSAADLLISIAFLLLSGPDLAISAGSRSQTATVPGRERDEKVGSVKVEDYSEKVGGNLKKVGGT